jgi:hypothetical protein
MRTRVVPQYSLGNFIAAAVSATPVGVFPPQSLGRGNVAVLVASPGGLQSQSSTTKAQQILSDYELAKKLQEEENRKTKKLSNSQQSSDELNADFLLALKLQEEENQQHPPQSLLSDEELARKLQEEEDKKAKK